MTGKPVDIERGVPIPITRHHKYPWESMEVGDSFFVSAEDDLHPSAVYQSALRACKRYAPRKYKSRTVDGGWRVWRTE